MENFHPEIFVPEEYIIVPRDDVRVQKPLGIPPTQRCAQIDYLKIGCFGIKYVDESTTKWRPNHSIVVY